MVKRKKQNLSKYSEQVRKIRTISKEFILELLEDNPLGSKEICIKIKQKYPEYCKDEIKCHCGSSNSLRPEWIHQILWAIQDLKYKGKLNSDKKTRIYSIS